MSKKKNRYKQKAKKENLWQQITKDRPTEKNATNTAIETTKAIVVGVLGGGLIGAVIGKPSFLVGVATAGVGFYSGNRLVQLMAMGMMASHTVQKATSVSGLEGLEGIKERVQAYKETLTERLYLDKILKKKAGTTNGIGELQYFTYNDNSMNGALAALNDIEDQIAESARQFEGQFMSANEFLLGSEDDMGELSERIY